VESILAEESFVPEEIRHGFFIAFFTFYVRIFLTMSQDNLIQLKNKETGEVYWTRKNRKLVTRKVEFKKFSKKLKKHVVFKEAKK
jgi:large subunit ribosomal protein L33